NGLRSEAVPPRFTGHKDPDLLLVCWGSTQGAAEEAAISLSCGGWKVGVLHFSQVWPLAPEQFMSRLRGAKEVVCVEGNATGQFARLLRGETGFTVSGAVLRYDGLPFTADFIQKGVESWLIKR
ncbi:MAG: 2-oxoacid:acceptor oxidoreductase subunit alpha, partial [Verrucomicrobia bacterium]|nr:2-oxoacid:acceptor oxidoreductase subunit alpha [Verrucomicrobiota bacterium]